MRQLPVRLSRSAEHDVAGIYRRRLAQRGADGEDGADAWLQGIVVAIEGLATFPDRGPVPPELEALGISTYRQLLHVPFRIIYERSDDTVTVMIVADGRRDFRTLLEERLLMPPR